MSIILALLAALFASFTAILAKVGIENVNSNLATAIRTIVVVIMAFMMVMITGRLDTIPQISISALWYILLSGFATGFSWLFFFKALAIGDVSKVVPIDKSSVVLTIIFSILVLGEAAEPLVLIGGAIIAIGTFILIGKNEEKNTIFRFASVYCVCHFSGDICSTNIDIGKNRNGRCRLQCGNLFTHHCHSFVCMGNCIFPRNT